MFERLLLASVLFASLTLAAPPSAEADCFGFRGENIKVCLDGSDNSARRKAAEVCEDVVGHSCSVSGSSGSCRRSSSVRCYDESGDEQSSIDPD